MVKYWIFVLGVITPTGVSAGSLDDFSNNLATDLGPLLVLFGEAMTKQYLSECTSFLDYFIFALAPIGILTAMTSAIRVCGYPALRAFIGRAQEGQGAVEAELCTSTSRDVCELYNRGGITRVLGRPSILELVYILSGKGNKSTAGLYLFKDYLQSEHNQLWDRVKSSNSRQTTLKEDHNDDNGFAPHPNISLNAGIVKHSDWVFAAVAVGGFILQGGLIALAIVGAWKLDWAVKDTGSPSSTDYAPIMYVTGTVLMAIGIWGCAAVIGQSTDEIEYRRVPPQPSEQNEPQMRRFWLQPGPQYIGDQFFDPFAHAESVKNPLSVWISSTKNFNNNFQTKCTMAVGATLIGYIMQFIGLRGMKAWLSIAQLAVCVVMSMARGALRAQRVSHDDNLLRERPDLVTGHELDWMAFQILETETPVWHITGQYEKAVVGGVDGSASSSFSSPSNKASSTSSSLDNTKGSHNHYVVNPDSAAGPLDGDGDSRMPSSSVGSKGGRTHGADLDNSVPAPCHAADKAQASCEDLLRIRVRLAQLTGHLPLGKTDDGHQKWKDEYVKVRSQAMRVSAAICQAAEKLLVEQIPNHDVTLRILATTSPDAAANYHVIDITLKPPSDETLGGWQIDSAQVEAILGLSMWSLISSGHKTAEIPSGNEKVPAEGIISAALERHGVANKQQEIDLWLGSQKVMLKEATLELDLKASHGIFDLWEDPKSISRDRNLGENERPAKIDHADCDNFRNNGVSRNKESRSVRSGTEAISNEGNDKAGKRDDKDKNESANLSNTLGDGIQNRATTRGWEKENGDIWTMASQDTLRQKNPGKRFCGWNAVYEALKRESDLTPTPSSTQSEKYRIQTFTCTGSLLDICARELFSALAASLASLCHVVAPTFDAKGDVGSIQLESETVTILTKACTENALGSQSEALLSVVTALGKQLQTPTDEEMLPTLISKAETYRRDGEWQRAEQLLRWACDYYSSPDGQYGASTGSRGGLFEKVLLAIGEFYLWAYRESFATKTKGFARKGIDWMHRKYESPTRAPSATTDILKRYRHVQNKMMSVSSLSNEQLLVALKEQIENKNREETLYYLCRIRDFRLEPFQPAFTLAVRYGWSEVVASMLEMGANIDSWDTSGRTAVSYCAELGYDLKPYIDGGADVNVEARGTGEMPLHYAIQNGHEAAVKLLIEAEAYIKVRTSDEFGGLMPLHYAAKYGRAGMVKLLIGAHAKVGDKGTQGLKAIHIAAQSGNVAVARALICEDIFKFERSGNGGTPLHFAARSGHEAMAKFLIDEGSDVHAKDNRGRTPLAFAAQSGNEAIIKLLLDKGCDAHTKTTWGYTVLHHAAMFGHEAVARFFIERRGVNARAEDYDGCMPLHYAARDGHEAVTKLFIDEGVDVHAKDSNGCTPLHHAAENGRKAIIKLLESVGGDMHAKSKCGDTPEKLLANWEKDQNGSDDVHTANSDEDPALHDAAESQRKAEVQFLFGAGQTNWKVIDIGADIDVD